MTARRISARFPVSALAAAAFATVAAAAAAVLLAPVPAVAGEGGGDNSFVFVHAGAGGDLHWVGDDEGEAFDLSDLADGERRTFGSGDAAVTVERAGDRIEIRRGTGPHASCIAGEDECRVIEAGDRVLVEIRKQRGTGTGSGGDARVFVRSIGGDGAFATASGHSVHVVRDCAGEDDCESPDVLVERIGAPHGIGFAFGDGFRRQIWKNAADVDGCPDGYRTMRFTDETAADGYLCIQERRPNSPVY